MQVKHIFAFAGLLAGSLLALSTAPAQAFSFTTNFTSTLSGANASKGNIWLNSVTLSDNTVISDFSLVNRATIIKNDQYHGGNSGAASSERGDLATGVKAEDPTPANIVASLGNLNLNNIIDTEDTGSFKMNLFFESAVEKLFFWERGMNSILGVQALDSSGNPFGNFLALDSQTWNYAGFGINTTEIGVSQPVGSLGVSLADLGVSGPISAIQVVSKRNYDGPDFKVVGSESVPEPATIAGLSLIAGTFAASRRRKAAKQA